MLAAGDRDDGPDLAGGGGLAGSGTRGLGPGDRPLSPGRGADVRWRSRRAGQAGADVGLGLEPGQLVVDGLLGGDEGVADLLVEAGQVAEQACFSSTSRLQLAPIDE